jgi:hypothetical protein
MTQTQNQRFPQFNPELLLEEDYSQLQNWEHGKGSSIYVSWVPDEMNEYVANDYFNSLGEIDRVEFAPLKTGKGRMMFVHFKEWYLAGTEPIRAIAMAYPASYNMAINFRDNYGNVKTYDLKCTVNTRPIKKVEYNIHQLADMFQQLKTQFETQSAEIYRLNAEVQRLNTIVASVEDHEYGAEYGAAQIYPECEEGEIKLTRSYSVN